LTRHPKMNAACMRCALGRPQASPLLHRIGIFAMYITLLSVFVRRRIDSCFDPLGSSAPVVAAGTVVTLLRHRRQARSCGDGEFPDLAGQAGGEARKLVFQRSYAVTPIPRCLLSACGHGFSDSSVRTRPRNGLAGCLAIGRGEQRLADPASKRLGPSPRPDGVGAVDSRKPACAARGRSNHARCRSGLGPPHRLRSKRAVSACAHLGCGRGLRLQRRAERAQPLAHACRPGGPRWPPRRQGGSR
jgi:hypothetical protein